MRRAESPFSGLSSQEAKRLSAQLKEYARDYPDHDDADLAEIWQAEQEALAEGTWLEPYVTGEAWRREVPRAISQLRREAAFKVQAKAYRQLAKERHQIREREIEKLGATFVPFTAQTRMSGVNMNGRQIRKGAPDAIETHVRNLGGVFPPEVRQSVDAIAKAGATPLVVCDGPRVLGAVQLT